MNISNELRILLTAIDRSALSEAQSRAYDKVKAALDQDDARRNNPQYWVFYE